MTAKWQAVWEEVQEAGSTAWTQAVPDAIVVTDEATGQQWHWSDGLCGFSWVIIKDGRSGLARFLRSKGIGHKHYYGGWAVPSWSIASVDRTSQSYQRKTALTEASLKVLEKHGVEATVESRLD